MPKYELTVRYSELATLAECQLKYLLGYANALVNSDSKPALTRGSAWHALMQGRYESFRRDDDAGVPRDLERARRAAGARLAEFRLTAEGRGVTDELLETLRWMYTGYDEKYGTEDDWDEIIRVEQRRVVPLLTHLGVRVNLAVTADLIVHHRGWDRYLLVDHKTHGNKDASKHATAKENQLDPQRKLYTASYHAQGPKKDRLAILGAIHNVARPDKLVRAMTLDERFGRGVVYYNDRELAAVWVEAKNIARDAVEIRLGRGRANRMYPSPDPERCGWKCQFKEVHLTSAATGRDPASVALDFGFAPAEEGNPLIGVLESR